MSGDRRWLRDALAHLFIDALPPSLSKLSLETTRLLEIDPNAVSSFVIERATIASTCQPLIEHALSIDSEYNEIVTQILGHTELRSAFATFRDVDEGSDEEVRKAALSTISLLYRKFAALLTSDCSPRAEFDLWWPPVRAQLFESKQIALRLLRLSDFKVDKPYKLTRSLIIRPEVASDRERRMKLSRGDHSLLPATTVLESLDVVGDLDFAPSQDERALEVALAVLCGVPLPTVYIEQYLTSIRGWGGTTTSAPPPYARWYGGTVSITSDKRAADLREFIHLSRDARAKPVVDLATRRYVSGLFRRSVEDRLIDYWIALEALFGENEGELTFRIALRLAAFLGSSADERQNIFATAKKSYKLRSQIVHGARGDFDMPLIDATESMIRRSLYKIIRAPMSYDRGLIEAGLLSGSELATRGMEGVQPMPILD